MPSDSNPSLSDARDEERLVALGWEVKTGADSIDTIERVYTRRRSGAYECIYPGCEVARRDSHAMWRHVHTGHGNDSLPPADFDYGPYV